MASVLLLAGPRIPTDVCVYKHRFIALGGCRAPSSVSEDACALFVSPQPLVFCSEVPAKGCEQQRAPARQVPRPASRCL